jgi:hypothetical protein
MSDFHRNYLKGKSLAIACPKLDTNTDVYLNKITAMMPVRALVSTAGDDQGFS